MNFKWTTSFDNIPVGEYVLLTAQFGDEEDKRWVTMQFFRN